MILNLNTDNKIEKKIFIGVTAFKQTIYEWNKAPYLVIFCLIKFLKTILSIQPLLYQLVLYDNTMQVILGNVRF